MKYCEKLFSELNLEPDRLSPCCNTKALRIPAFPYSGGPIDMRAYGAHIQKTVNEIQGGSQVCDRCPELLTKDGSLTATLVFRAVSINMHRFFCNCRCEYCNLWQQGHKGYGYDPLPALQSLKEQNALRPECFISWGGGEPSILPTFEQASSWALENGYFQYVHTNALRYSPALANVLGEKRGRINVSLDSGTAETYRRVKGIDGFTQVIGNLGKYAAKGGANVLNLKYIIYEANNSFDEIARFLELAKELGAGDVEFSFNFLETNAGKVSEQTIGAAAFFVQRAQSLGLKWAPFFVDPVWLGKIEKKILETE